MSILAPVSYARCVHSTLLAMALAGALGAASGVHAGYIQTNLVSDIPLLAAHTDPNLVNPWGIASSASSPFWIADNGSAKSTLYNGSGEPFPVGSPLVVTIPPTGASPTGLVFNASGDFEVTPGSPARFIFATEGGTIAAWSSGTSAATKADLSAAGAAFTGLAIGSNAAGNALFAANFGQGSIDVFDKNFSLTFGASDFLDPNLPAGYSPFNVQNLGGTLYVTYALQDATGEEVAGAGLGLVDAFDLDGNLLRRVISPGGALNAPWGLALAPSAFGELANGLLIGNFGDGIINAFDPLTGVLLGTLSDQNGDPIVNQGLWGIKFGNGGNGGDPNALYFTAGIPGPGAIEEHGLFGRLAVAGAPSTAAPEPATIALLALGLLALVLRAPSRNRRISSGLTRHA